MNADLVPIKSLCFLFGSKGYESGQTYVAQPLIAWLVFCC